jgi:hypothetical protein
VAGLTATALADALVDSLRRRDLTRFILVGWMLISLPVLAYIQMATKYLVPSAPAVALLVAMAAREVAWGRRAVSIGAAAGTAASLLILQADARYADLGRRAAAELIAPHVAAGQRVWFIGHWGLQWYAERAGGYIFTRTPPYPHAGDLMVIGHNMHGRRMRKFVPDRELVTSIAERRPGARVMSAGAGFWSNAWGYLPWAWAGEDDLVEQLDLWKLNSGPAGNVATTPE